MTIFQSWFDDYLGAHKFNPNSETFSALIARGRNSYKNRGKFYRCGKPGHFRFECTARGNNDDGDFYIEIKITVKRRRVLWMLRR